MNSGFLLLLTVLFVSASGFLFFGCARGGYISFLSGAAFLFSFGFLLGGYIQEGQPFKVGSRGSTVEFSFGHSYYTLVKVPVQAKKGNGEAKTGTFVIKDGRSDQIQIILTNHEDLPPYFTVDKYRKIVALPAPTLAASAPATSEALKK